MAYKRSKIELKIPSVFKHLYVISVVAMGWVLFRADNLLSGVKYWGNLIGIGTTSFSDSYSLFTLKSTMNIFIIGIFFCFPVAKKTQELVRKKKELYNFVNNVLMTAIYVGLLLICIAYMQIGTYNPFLYNNF